MSLFLPLLAVAADPDLGESFRFQVTGLLVVLTALGALCVLIALIGRFFLAAERRTRAAAASERHAGVATGGGAVPPEIQAVIAAAVAAVLQGRHFAVRAVHYVEPDQRRAWSLEGRRQIYASHQVR